MTKTNMDKQIEKITGKATWEDDDSITLSWVISHVNELIDKVNEVVEALNDRKPNT